MNLIGRWELVAAAGVLFFLSGLFMIWVPAGLMALGALLVAIAVIASKPAKQ